MIKICDPNAFEYLCVVEGPEYERNQRNFGDVSFWAFKAAWLKQASWWRVKYWDATDPRALALMDFLDKIAVALGIIAGSYRGKTVHVSNFAVVIYGYGGWNRYVVRSVDGAILFHRGMAAGKQYLEKAKEVGFAIFPDDIDKF